MSNTTHRKKAARTLAAKTGLTYQQSLTIITEAISDGYDRNTATKRSHFTNPEVGKAREAAMAVVVAAEKFEQALHDPEDTLEALVACYQASEELADVCVEACDALDFDLDYRDRLLTKALEMAQRGDFPGWDHCNLDPDGYRDDEDIWNFLAKHGYYTPMHGTSNPEDDHPASECPGSSDCDFRGDYWRGTEKAADGIPDLLVRGWRGNP